MIKRLIVCAVLLGACAQASSPPGAPPDKQPPRIIESVPAEGAVVPDFTGPVRIRFDKVLSEKGAAAHIDDVIALSPETEGVQVSRHGNELRIHLKGGWQKGRIYHVTVLPGLQDRFGNIRPVPYDLMFSTGPEILPTALAGVVMDRLTNKPVANARVTAMGADSVRYTALTDTGGFYALRSLPVHAYSVTAFVDVNRNRKLDGLEPRDTRAAAIMTARDTQVVALSVLAKDTTPARLLKAEARDSMQVRLSFDDFIEPSEQLGGVQVTVWHLPDSIPVAGSLFHVRDYEAKQLAAQKVEAKPPATQRPEARPSTPTTARAGAPQDTTRLPEQELVWSPVQPLTPSTHYRVAVRGIPNINGLTGGGGSVTFETPAPPKPAAPPDTTKALKRAKPDSIKHVP